MMIGGGLYTLGIVFYAVKRIPWNHVIWHFFVIGGAVGLHVGIFLYAVPKIISLHI
jgi:hemolysin III